jgi:hypothetical protein
MEVRKVEKNDPDDWEWAVVRGDGSIVEPWRFETEREALVASTGVSVFSVGKSSTKGNPTPDTHLCLGVHPCKDCADKPRNLVIKLPRLLDVDVELLVRSEEHGEVTVDMRKNHGVWIPADFIDDLTWELRS